MAISLGLRKKLTTNFMIGLFSWCLSKIYNFVMGSPGNQLRRLRIANGKNNGQMLVKNLPRTQ